MSAKHAQVLWFAAPEATQASSLLSTIQEEAATPDLAQTPASTDVEVKISTDPTPDIADVKPPEDSLPFVPDMTGEASP